jgi:hypothetical protein
MSVKPYILKDLKTFDDENFLLKVLRHNGLELMFIPYEAQTLEMCETALKQDRLSVVFMKQVYYDSLRNMQLYDKIQSQILDIESIDSRIKNLILEEEDMVKMEKVKNFPKGTVIVCKVFREKLYYVSTLDSLQRFISTSFRGSNIFQVFSIVENQLVDVENFIYYRI